MHRLHFKIQWNYITGSDSLLTFPSQTNNSWIYENKRGKTIILQSFSSNFIFFRIFSSFKFIHLFRFAISNYENQHFDCIAPTFLIREKRAEILHYLLIMNNRYVSLFLYYLREMNKFCCFNSAFLQFSIFADQSHWYHQFYTIFFFFHFWDERWK